MPINANVSGQPQIQASVGETQIDVSVAGGFGPSGTNGAAASITVGTVTTGSPGSSASVVNAGTTSAAVLNFVIPAGATGAQGERGLQGERGEQGIQGIQGPAGATGATGPAGSNATATTDASALVSGILPDARLSANIARTSDVTAAVASVVGAAPESLNTLQELSAALANDASFSATVTNSLAAKAPINNPTFTGTVGGITAAMVGLGNVANVDATARANHTGTQAASTITGLATVATSGSASDITAGTLDNARLPSALSPTSITTINGNVTAYGGLLRVTAFPAGTTLFSVSTAGIVTVGTWQGTAVGVGFGGTGATTASAARANLGLAIGTDVPALSHTHSATEVTSGQFDIARIPTGQTSTTVPLGNDARFTDARTPTAHVHSGSDIQSGTVAAARLGSGAAETTFLRGDSTFAPVAASVNGSTGAVTLPTMVEFTMAGGPAGSTFVANTGFRTYTWSFPSNAQYAIIEVQGAGSGGGSGRRGAAGTNRGGGGGGAAGPFRRLVWRLADLTSRTVTLQIASGGAGGAAVTADDTNGNAGSQPAAQTNIAGEWAGFPVLVRAGAPGNGGGGSTSGGSSGSGAIAQNDPFGGTTGGAGGVGAAGSNASAAWAEASTGGGGGGGLDTANNTRAGGSSGSSPYIGAQSGAAGGTAGGGNGAAGSGFGASICATGGGGGGSSVSSAGGNGGNGTKGSGGGGGGASANGFNSGAGGNGGDGYIRVILF